MKGLDSMRQKLRQINDISIGNNLRNLRNAANLTQEQVVAQLQLRNLPTTRSIYSQIEAGTYNIKISELIALSEILHTDFNTIFDGLSIEKKPWIYSFLSFCVPRLSYYSCLFQDYNSISRRFLFFGCSGNSFLSEIILSRLSSFCFATGMLKYNFFDPDLCSSHSLCSS